MTLRGNNSPGGSSVQDRVRGGIAILLCITCFVWANFTDSKQVQAGLVVAGILYLCTCFAHFPDTVGGDPNED